MTKTFFTFVVPTNITFTCNEVTVVQTFNSLIVTWVARRSVFPNNERGKSSIPLQIFQNLRVPEKFKSAQTFKLTGIELLLHLSVWTYEKRKMLITWLMYQVQDRKYLHKILLIAFKKTFFGWNERPDPISCYQIGRDLVL